MIRFSAVFDENYNLPMVQVQEAKEKDEVLVEEGIGSKNLLGVGSKTFLCFGCDTICDGGAWGLAGGIDSIDVEVKKVQ